MSANHPSIDELILDALEQEGEFVGHARGADAVRPSYFLHEIDAPEPVAPIARDAIGSTSAAIVEELKPMPPRSASTSAPTQTV